MRSNLPLIELRRQLRIGLLALLFFGFFINLLVLTTPIFMMQVFDRVLSSGSVETLVFLGLIAGIAVLALGFLEIVRGYLLTRIGSWIEKMLSPFILRASVDGAMSGRVTSAQGLRDAATLRAFFGGESVRGLLDLIWTPAFIAAMWIIHPLVGWVSIVFCVLLIVFAVLNEFATRSRVRKASELQIAANGFAEHAIRNADVISAMGMMDAFQKCWADVSKSGWKNQSAASDRGGWFKGLSRFVRLLAQISTLGLGAYLVLAGEMTAGGMIAGSILSARALAPVEIAISSWKGLISARAAYGRLEVLLENEGPDGVAMELPAPKGHVSVEHLEFSFPNQEQPTLQDINMSVEPGQIIGIVGHSAGGKSTLCRLLIGSLKPTHGTIRLDGAEIHKWSPTQLGKHVGYLPQNIELFPGSVQLNIARMQKDIDPKLVIEASQSAGIHEMVLRLPQGYDTDIGPHGARLSGGQRQRIGLARALFGSPQLIVLDEPNSNLDWQGDESLSAALLAARDRGATIFVVSHKPALLGLTDKLAVLNQGKLQRFGESDEILSLVEAKSTERLVHRGGPKLHLASGGAPKKR